VLTAMARGIDEHRLLARVSRPVLAILSRKLRRTAHLGVLEDGMVTYLAKVAHGPAAAFTREDMQLEAYCSGIGKVLLARLSPAEREAYLGEGPFVALTQNTIVDPAELAEHLNQVRAQNYARDDAEVFEDLRCVAVPILRADGSAAAAISVSTTGPEADELREGQALAALQGAAAVIETKMSFAKVERAASSIP
jgi:IclR family acetate operon transcriptional repressor